MKFHPTISLPSIPSSFPSPSYLVQRLLDCLMLPLLPTFLFFWCVLHTISIHSPEPANLFAIACNAVLLCYVMFAPMYNNFLSLISSYTIFLPFSFRLSSHQQQLIRQQQQENFHFTKTISSCSHSLDATMSPTVCTLRWVNFFFLYFVCVLVLLVRTFFDSRNVGCYNSGLNVI